MAETHAPRAELTGRAFYGYGLGSVAQGVAGQALSTSLISQFLFLVVGMPALLVGTAIVISQAIDAVVDPLLGLWSDRTRGPLGRRHPFMYASALPCAAGFYALWHPPTGLGGVQLFAYMLALLVLVRFFTAMYDIPSAALAPELSRDYHLRTRLFAVRTYFGTIAGGLMTILLNVVFLRHDAAHKLGVLNRAGYSDWGAIAAGLILVSILWSSWSTHRLIPTLSAPARRSGGAAAILAEVIGTMRNPSFLALMISGLVSSIAGGISAALGPYLTLYFFDLSPQVAGLMLFAYGPAVFIGAIQARRVSMQFGKKQALIWLSVVSLAASLAPIALRLVGFMPANGSPLLIPTLLVTNFLGVTCSTMTSVILASMFADLADDNAVRTGARTEGLLFALNGLIPKLSTGIGAFGGSALIALVGFPAKAQQGTVPQSILHALGLAYLPVAVVLYGLSIVIIAFYRIDHATHEANLAALAPARVGVSGEP